jgi:hypothetical protein
MATFFRLHLLSILVLASILANLYFRTPELLAISAIATLYWVYNSLWGNSWHCFTDEEYNDLIDIMYPEDLPENISLAKHFDFMLPEDAGFRIKSGKLKVFKQVDKQVETILAEVTNIRISDDLILMDLVFAVPSGADSVFSVENNNNVPETGLPSLKFELVTIRNCRAKMSLYLGKIERSSDNEHLGIACANYVKRLSSVLVGETFSIKKLGA